MTPSKQTYTFYLCELYKLLTLARKRGLRAIEAELANPTPAAIPANSPLKALSAEPSAYFGLVITILQAFTQKARPSDEQIEQLAADYIAQHAEASQDLLNVIWTTLRAANQGCAPQIAIEFGRWVVPAEHRPAYAQLQQASKGLDFDVAETPVAAAPASKEVFTTFLRLHFNISSRVRREGLMAIESDIEQPEAPGSIFEPLQGFGVPYVFFLDLWRLLVVSHVDDDFLQAMVAERIEVECRNPAVSRELLKAIWVGAQASVLEYDVPQAATQHALATVPEDLRPTMQEVLEAEL